MKKLTIVALLSGLMIQPAWSDDFYDFPAVDDYAGKFYGGVDLASASYGGSFYPSSTGIRIAAGYNILSTLAIEVGYAMLSSSSNNCSYGCGYGGYGYGYSYYPYPPPPMSSYSFNSSSLQIAAVGSYPISDAFSIFGKFGFDNNSMNYASTDMNGNNLPTISGSQHNRLYGFGGQYNVGGGVVIRAQYEDLGNVAPSIGMRMISIGGVYNF